MGITSISACVESLMNRVNHYINDLDKQGVLHMENIIEYKYKDLFNVKSIVKVCPRCAKLFVPNYNSRNTQIYCGDDCRYNSTEDTRKELHFDDRYRKIDNLRKLIYEKKYRAKRDNKLLTTNVNNGFEEILDGCKKLTKDRKKITLYEFTKRYDKLMQQYRSLSKR